MNVLERSIRAANGCLEFTGARNRQGYGVVGVHGKTYLVHRLMWIEEHGPIPEGMCVLHRCDNPPCFASSHLFVGTRDDNNKDMAAKGRVQRKNALKTHCKQGHPFTPANTYISRGYKRDCKICRHDAAVRFQARKEVLV